ncbi:MAG: hypothetical protein LBM71_02045, partial [Elusimicrobiota bacterium]|nr:hypothetical protein [Elusimicrobiota bacterium]
NLSRRKKSLYLGLFSIIFVMATGCLVDYHFFIPANAVLLCIVLGLVAAPTFFKNRAKRIYIGIAPKIMLALIAVALLYIPINKAIAWRTMLFAKNLEPAAKLEQYENALTYYNGHRYASRLGIEYYKQSKNKRLSEEERAKYQEKAGQTAKKYLLIYPKEKELTRLFFISRQ